MMVSPMPVLGQKGPDYEVGPLTRTDIVRYAGAGGDFNPIHNDEPFARSAGYPSVFGHGLLTAGILGGYVADWLGLGRLRKYSVRYVAQVWPGDRLACSGVVTNVTAGEDGVRVECTLSVERCAPDGTRQVVLTGAATALYSETA